MLLHYGAFVYEYSELLILYLYKFMYIIFYLK